VLDGGEALEPVSDHDPILTLADHGHPPSLACGCPAPSGDIETGHGRGKVVLTPL
jgi:hypothetical protein